MLITKTRRRKPTTDDSFDLVLKEHIMEPDSIQ